MFLRLVCIYPTVPHAHHFPFVYSVDIPLIFFIILLKSYLQGFMTFFPLVGLFAAYESRKSLWTTCREVPILLFMLSAVLIIIRLTQAVFSLGQALIISWAAMMAYFIPRFIYIARKITNDGAKT